MKKIERPDSTSYVMEVPFHLIKNKIEFENIMKDIVNDQIIDLGLFIEPNTFQPMKYFAIKLKPDDGFPFWLKYVVELELTV